MKILKKKKDNTLIKKIVYPDGRDDVEEVLVSTERLESRALPKRKKLTNKDKKVIEEIKEYLIEQISHEKQKEVSVINYDKFVDGTLETRITYLANLASKLNDVLDKIQKPPYVSTPDINIDEFLVKNTPAQSVGSPENMDAYFTELGSSPAVEKTTSQRWWSFLKNILGL